MAITSFAQDKEVRAIYKAQPDGDGVTKIHIPGWIVRMGVNLSAGKSEAQDPENTLMHEFLRTLKGLRLMMVENPPEHLYERLRNLGKKQAKKKNYKEMITVRTGNEFINVWMQDKLKKRKGIRFIKRLLISVGEKEELILVSIKGRWNLRLILDNLGTIKDMAPMLNGSLM